MEDLYNLVKDQKKKEEAKEEGTQEIDQIQ